MTALYIGIAISALSIVTVTVWAALYLAAQADQQMEEIIQGRDK